MDNKGSEGAATFGFNKPKAADNKQSGEVNNSPNDTKEDVKVSEVNDPTVENEVKDKNGEYTDVRSITIMPVKNYSLYRRVNDKVLAKRNDFIGSSVSSSRILSSNKDEVEAYFPALIGLAPNNENFITRVKQYLNNIKIPVDELGKTFDISFHYNHITDYYIIKGQEDKIEQEFNNSDRSDVGKLRKAINTRITKLNVLEGTKHKFGYPVNLEDYLMYRHCLLYNDVAKDISLINSDPSIRFYFKDDDKEAAKLKKYRQAVNKAKANYVACLADDNLFDAVYTQYCVISNLPIIPSLSKNRIDREIELDRFSEEHPAKFNSIYANKDIKLIAIIEKLIAHGELIRSQYNQNITGPDGDFIGANMNEAIAWFKNPANNPMVTAYYNKLKNI